MTEPTGPLKGLKVFDLTRVLAGPTCAQMLADLGADVIKIERPGAGDDTRGFAPPFMPGTKESAYFIGVNRNKRSLTLDIAKPEGQEIALQLIAQSDILVENFKVGALANYGLGWEQLKAKFPRLIYCSITGFGQTGPYAARAGYDFVIQGMAGVMSVTGRPEGEPGAGPLKVGVPIADLVTGLYAAIAVLAALNHRHATGVGQHIDCALMDCQMALLANQASNYLNGGMVPRAMGNQHPNLVPYQDFACADGAVLVAHGNDRQFRTLCEMLGREDLAADERFATSGGRSTHRAALLPQLAKSIAGWQADDLCAAIEAAGLPGGKINTVPQALADPQVAARGLVHEMAREDGTPVRVLGFPPQFSATPARYDQAPPRAGQDTGAVLRELGLDADEIARLHAAGVIGG